MRRARILLPAGMVLLAAACGGSGPPPPPLYLQSVAYMSCLHAHGAPQFPGPVLGPGGVLVHPLAPPPGMLSSPGYDRAFRACERLMPGPKRPAAMLGRALTVAACMRAHGITGYPDPAAVDGGLHVPDLWRIGVDTHTLQFQAAGDACQAGDLWLAEWWWPAGSL
jgi:hypothetical protein